MSILVDLVTSEERLTLSKHFEALSKKQFIRAHHVDNYVEMKLAEAKRNKRIAKQLKREESKFSLAKLFFIK